MKTKFTLKSAKSISVISLSVILLSCGSASAQNKFKNNFGIRGSSTISANRFGIIYCPSVSYRSGNSLISLGFTIQKNKSAPSGYQVNYEYTLLDPAKALDCNIDWFELYTFMNMSYQNRAFLGKTACEEECFSNPEITKGLSELELKSMDCYAGFGARIILFNNLKWFNGIGVGGYRVFNISDKLYYNNKGLGLLLRTGISYQFSNRDKEKF